MVEELHMHMHQRQVGQQQWCLQCHVSLCSFHNFTIEFYDKEGRRVDVKLPSLVVSAVVLVRDGVHL